MEEAYKFVMRLSRMHPCKFFKQSSSKSIMWARWCLPQFNPNCDQQRKGHLADADNSSCDTLISEYRKKLKKKNSSPFPPPPSPPVS